MDDGGTPRDADAGLRAERLQKYLARAGVASRRKAEVLIVEGKVSVNGRPAELGSRVGPGDEVRVEGRLVAPAAEPVSFMLNKPAGVITTAHDERGRATVMALVPSVAGLHPVGRLDLDSEGLLILTTDGELTLRLTHPRYRHEKEYRVWCAQGVPSRAALAALRAGVDLDDGPAAALRVSAAPGGARLVIAEGRNRQVRRMFEAVGCTVTRLLRTRIAGLELGGLASGSHRRLGPDDLVALGYTRGAGGKAHRADRRRGRQ